MYFSAMAVLSDYRTHDESAKNEPSHAHLFDPRFDAVTEPQISGFSLTGAQNLTNLPVWEAVLLGLQQQLLWYRVTVGRENK